MLSKIQQALSAPSPPAPKLIGLIGESYSGKTTLVSKLNVRNLGEDLEYDDITASTLQEYIKKYQVLPSGKPQKSITKFFASSAAPASASAPAPAAFIVDGLESYSNAKHILTFLVETNQRAVITTTESILIPSNSKFQKIYLNTKREKYVSPEEIAKKDTFYGAPYQAAKVILCMHVHPLPSPPPIKSFIKPYNFHGSIIPQRMIRPLPRELLTKPPSHLYTEAYETDSFIVSHFIFDEYPKIIPAHHHHLAKASDWLSIADLTAPWNTSGATQTKEFTEWSASLVAHAPFVSPGGVSEGGVSPGVSEGGVSPPYTMKVFFPTSISKQGQVSRAKASLTEFSSTTQARHDLETIQLLGIHYFLTQQNSQPRYTADEINQLLKLAKLPLLTNKQIKEYTSTIHCFRITSD
jgi:hypothetical protein